MRIHLQLQGIFSVFPTRPLSLEELENWESYPVIFIAPDSDLWNPHFTHYAEEEAAMVDHFSILVECLIQPHPMVFNDVDVSELYASPISWDYFDEVISHVPFEDPVYGNAFDADKILRLDLDGIQAQLALLDVKIFRKWYNGMGAHISCLNGNG
jgi:hypothetical protein